MIILLAQYTAQPENLDAVLAALARMADFVSAEEPGCKQYQVSQNQDDPTKILIYEQYEDDAAIAYHRETDHFKAIILQQVIPMLVSREVAFFDLKIG